MAEQSQDLETVQDIVQLVGLANAAQRWLTDEELKAKYPHHAAVVLNRPKHAAAMAIMRFLRSINYICCDELRMEQLACQFVGADIEEYRKEAVAMAAEQKVRQASTIDAEVTNE
jgi:hypothetical protein